MNISQIKPTKYLILLVLSGIFIYVSCSAPVYSQFSFPVIKDEPDKQKLAVFLQNGTGKKIDMRNIKAEDIPETAMKYLGVPHCMGGTDRRCMDCSGLLLRVFADHGIQFPHSAEEQARYGEIISEAANLRKGDLVFFIHTYSTGRFITHSGIYLGGQEFIHASTTNGVTKTSMSDPWWKEKFIFGTRLY